MQGQTDYLADLPLTEAEWEEQFYRSQHNIIPFGSVAQGAIPKPPPLIEGVLLDRTITMISAEPYCGKTMFTLSLALSVATGLPFLDTFSVPTAKPVLYLGQDAPSWDYAEQTRKLSRGYGISDSGLDAIPLDFGLNAGVTITDPRFSRLLNDWHNTTGFGVLVMDTLASFHNFDENESRSMGLIMTALKRARDMLGCAIIFTHHTAKPMGDKPTSRSLNYAARGSSVIAGTVDFHYALHRAPTEDEDRINVHMPKGRGNEEFAALTHFTITDITHPQGDCVKLTPPLEFAGRKGIILEALRRGNSTRQAIAKFLLDESKKPLPEEKAHKIVENELQTLRKLGQISYGKEGWQLAS